MIVLKILAYAVMLGVGLFFTIAYFWLPLYAMLDSLLHGGLLSTLVTYSPGFALIALAFVCWGLQTAWRAALWPSLRAFRSWLGRP